MKTIHKNKVRDIFVHLVEGCEIEVATRPKAPQNSSSPKRQQLISFGTGIDKKEILFKHFLSDGGKKLIIDTFYQEDGKILSSSSYRFKIILPEGVYLRFTHDPQPLGW